MADGCEIVDLGPHDRMTVSQALGCALREAGRFSDVVVLAYNEDGGLVVRSSGMTREQALWIIKQAELYTLGQLE